MGLAEYKETLQKPLRQATLCFLINRQKEEILLAMKKRGFGKDLWNGVGGKVKPNESLLGAAARETQEEIKVKPISYRQVAVLDFYFPPNLDFTLNQKGLNLFRNIIPIITKIIRIINSPINNFS